MLEHTLFKRYWRAAMTAATAWPWRGPGVRRPRPLDWFGWALLRYGRKAGAEGLRMQPGAALAPTPTNTRRPAAEIDAFGVVYPHPKNQLKSIALPSSPKIWGNSSQVFEIPMLILSRFSSPSASAKGSTSNAHRSNRWALLAKPTFGVALAMGVLSAGQAQALVVNVGGQDLDVTIFTGTYKTNTSKFATAANGGVMPWWGSQALASVFALLVGKQLPTPVAPLRVV